MVNWYLPHQFYPPVPGLLQGESPSLFSYNRLGPFELRRTITIPSTRLGSEASVVFELDQRGYIQGLVSAFNSQNELRTTSWIRVEIKGAAAAYQLYTWDGWYDGYLSPEGYSILVTEWTPSGQGHFPQGKSISVSDGQMAPGLNFWLEESDIPINEFPSPAFVAPVLLCVVALSKRKRRLTKKA